VKDATPPRPGTPGVDRPIDRNDLLGGMRNLQRNVNEVKDASIGAGIAGAIGALLLGLILAFVIGRARGKKKYAFVEIRRA
jgi:hypothetical protein